MNSQNYRYLTYLAIGIAICGVITSGIGQSLLYQMHKNLQKNLQKGVGDITCDKQIVENDNTNISEYSGFITGYSILTFSIIFTIILSTIFYPRNLQSEKSILFNMLNLSLPAICTLGTVIYVLIIYSYYKNYIISGIIVDEFHIYSLIINILFLCQIGLLGYYILSISSEKKAYNAMYILYGFCLINLIVISVQHSKLQYFSTDG